MNIIVLTTETTHHAFFLRELSKSFPVKKAIIEQKNYLPPFEIYHPFEKARDDY